MQHPFIINKCGKLVTRASIKNAFHSRLAQAMSRPIRRSLDYQGIARRALVIQPLPPGALPCYDKIFSSIEPTTIEFKRDKFVINKHGKLVKRNIPINLGAGKVIFPTFEISKTPSIKLSEIKRRRFNVIDRGS